MNAVIEKLRIWGCDIDGAMNRMLNDEEFYMECLNTIPQEPSFEELEKSLKEKDLQKAFEHAHTLKGVLGNVGLTPMYKKSTEIVEPLRRGDDTGVEKMVKELMEMKIQFEEILKSN